MADPLARAHAGALARLTSKHPGVDHILLGPIPDRESAGDDPRVPVGTLCVVCGDYEDHDIVSRTAHVVLLEVGGIPQRFWVYSDELELL